MSAPGVSTFPLAIFGGEWAERTADLIYDLPSRGDTVVGNPARLVRTRFDETDVDRFLRSA